MSWTVMHEEGNCTLFPFYFYVEPWGRRLAPILGEDLDMLFVIKDGHMRECVIKEQYERLGRNVFNTLPAAFPRYMERTDYWLEKTVRLCEKLESEGRWPEKSDAELVAAFYDYCETLQNLNTWGMMITLMEYADSSFVSDRLFSLLKDHLGKTGNRMLPTQAMSLLTTPFQSTPFRDQRLEAVHLAREKALGKDVSVGISELHRDFAWIAYGYEGPVLGRDYFETQVGNLAQLPERDRQKIENEDSEILARQEHLEAELKLPEKIKAWLCIGRQFMFKKEYRKQISYRAFFAVEGLQKEIARKAGLSLRQLRFFTPDEVPDVLSGKLGADLANRRMALVAYHFENGKIQVLDGAQAEALERQIVQATVDPRLSELRGQCAYSDGRVLRGRARILFKAEELSRLEPGDFLISHSTNPNMLAGMKRAAAILTDQGGLTCHAAIVSRELKIPCVTGLKKATLLFRDGDWLEVDPSAGLVRKANG